MNSDLIRIGVISDTHGFLRRAVVSQLQDCSCILHAGDIVKETDLDELPGFSQRRPSIVSSA